MTGSGSGYLSGNMLVPFPFEDGQFLAWGVEDPLKSELQQALQRCFADACVSLLSQSVSGEEWPSIGNFSVSASSLSFTLGASADPSQDARLSVSASSEKFPIASGKAPWGAYVVVMSSDGIRDFCSLCAEKSISPPVQDSSSSWREGGFWLRLCSRCAVASPSGLLSLRVYDGVKPFGEGPHFILKGDVAVRAGNNVRLSEPDDGVNGFSVNAIPGTGLGRVPCSCDDAPGGNSALAGPDGHARLFNDTCYDLEPGEKFYDERKGEWSQELRIHVKCTACCSCGMYASIVERLAKIADRVRKARKKQGPGDRDGVYDIFEKYENSVKAFNDRLARPRLPEDATLSLTGVPIGKNVSPKISNPEVRGKMSRCAFTAVLRNSSFFEIIAKVVSIKGSDKIVEASASWSDESGAPLSRTWDSSSGVEGSTYSIFPGRSLVMTYMSTGRKMVSSVKTGGFTGSIMFELSWRDKDGTVKSLGSLWKNVEA